MIGHQHIGMDAALVFERRLLQSSKISAVIFLGGKARLAIVASLNDVLGNSGELETWQASHKDLRHGGEDASLNQYLGVRNHARRMFLVDAPAE